MQTDERTGTAQAGRDATGDAGLRAAPEPGPDPVGPDYERRRLIAGRWQEFEGEARANLLRVLAVCAFYLVELANYHGVDLGVLQYPKVASVDTSFHTTMTALCVVWIMLAWLVSLALRRQVFPSKLKVLSTACDICLMTAVLLLADGPRSPLLVGYFYLVNLAGLRLDPPLVRFATGASMFGYLVLLANARWYREALRVPRYHQVLFLLALAMTGLCLGQTIRRMRNLADECAASPTAGEGGAA
ncbi:MAG: hypothetical protein HY814_09275 [Candidatus Riflebacteria bacterium]|nr:hypothetical protein [Candidatus Riflebacteria bacterium]